VARHASGSARTLKLDAEAVNKGRQTDLDEKGSCGPSLVFGAVVREDSAPVAH
jgi:hypothetical protein